HYGMLVIAAFIKAIVTCAGAGIVDGVPAVRVRDACIVILDPGAVAGQRIRCWSCSWSWRTRSVANHHVSKSCIRILNRVGSDINRRIRTQRFVSVAGKSSSALAADYIARLWTTDLVRRKHNG